MATKIGLTFSHTVCVCMGVYAFVRFKYMCTYYRAPKAREQRSSDCTRLTAKPLAARVRGCLCICQTLIYVYLVSSAEGAKASVVGLHAASGDASRTCACALVFIYLLDLNICVLIIERRRRESSIRRTARWQWRSRQPHVCVVVYVFVRPKDMCTYNRAPKAREQRSSDCTRLAAKPLVNK